MEFLLSEPTVALQSISIAAKRQIIPDSKFIDTLKQINFKTGDSSLPHHFIKDELSFILTRKNPFIGISILSKSDFLGKIFPEVEALKKVSHEKDFHPEGNAYEHTIECFKYIESPSIELALSVLLHDIGKAKAIQNKNSKYKFPKHASIGANLAKNALRRLKFSDDIISKVEKIIENHMILPALPNFPIKKIKPILDSDYFQDLMRLYWADLSSSYAPPNPYFKTKSFYEDYLKQKALFEQYGVIKKNNK
jgi:poly(A) polymerase